MTDKPEIRPGWRLTLLPPVLLAAGLVMSAAWVWMMASASFGILTGYLSLGGPLAVGAAAVLGRGNGFTFKEFFFVLVVCSAIGGLANFGVDSMALSSSRMMSLAVGHATGTLLAVAGAFLAGSLIRRGASVRHTEEIAETFR